MLVLNVIVISRLKNLLNGVSIEFMECVNEDGKKKRKGPVYQGRAVIISTSSNLLDTKYEFYEFNIDLRDFITYEYNCHKAGFCKNKYVTDT